MLLTLYRLKKFSNYKFVDLFSFFLFFFEEGMKVFRRTRNVRISICVYMKIIKLYTEIYQFSRDF